MSSGTYTADLHDIAQWLLENGIQSVAMESTGVFWIPIFETLEARGFKCCLIAATAHKIARVVYYMLKFKIEYQVVSAYEYDQRFREREIRYLQRKLPGWALLFLPQQARFSLFLSVQGWAVQD